MSNTNNNNTITFVFNFTEPIPLNSKSNIYFQLDTTSSITDLFNDYYYIVFNQTTNPKNSYIFSNYITLSKTNNSSSYIDFLTYNYNFPNGFFFNDPSNNNFEIYFLNTTSPTTSIIPFFTKPFTPGLNYLQPFTSNNNYINFYLQNLPSLEGNYTTITLVENTSGPYQYTLTLTQDIIYVNNAQVAISSAQSKSPH